MSTTTTTQLKDARRALKSKSPSGLFRKLTTRLKPSSLQPKPANLDIPSPPNSPTRRPPVPTASTDLAAIRRRQAALQQCGLVAPPKRDLSQLEAELDKRFSHVVDLSQEQQDQGELTSAERIRREWQAKNEEKQLNSQDPSNAPSDPSNPEEHAGSGNAQASEAPELDLLLSLKTPLPLSPIHESFPDIPEEDVVPSGETEKVLSPLLETVDPLTVPLPDSPLSSSTDLPDLSPSPTPRDARRLPPIVVNLTANPVKETDDEVTRGRSLNRDSVQSIASKPSLPALSPTVTASSSSSLQTPRDEESRERMETMITRPSSTKSSRFGKASDIRRDSEDLHVVPEGPELGATDSKPWNPSRESGSSMGSAGFEAFVERREQRRRMSTGIFQPTKRSSGSILSSRKSAGSELSLMWSSFGNDFALKPLNGGKSKSSTLPSKPTLADGNKEPTPAQSQATSEQQSKITRSKSVIASLGLRMGRKTVTPTLSPSLPPTPMRRPTVRIVDNRANLIQEVKGIEDDESRRLTEMAFMDF